MLALLKKKNPYEQKARGVFGAVLIHVRNPIFYERMAVPDSFDGRFDLMLVHLFLLIDRALDEGAAGQDFNQALFDATFAEMDQSLREMGIGDMGVPKRMRKMMKAFNGRMHAYRAALAGGDLSEALARNLYGTLEEPPQEGLVAMQAYIEQSRDMLKNQPFENIADGHARFGAL